MVGQKNVHPPLMVLLLDPGWIKIRISLGYTVHRTEVRYLDGLAWRAVFPVPGLDERHVNVAARAPGAQVEGTRRPQQRNTVGRVVRVQRRLLQERAHLGNHTMKKEKEFSLNYRHRCEEIQN
jgi:hypothetical protein